MDINELFSSIESLKNGLLFSGKYESGQLVTPNPHVIIFSNWLPPNPRKLSRDRWNIFRIGNSSKDLIPMDAAQCNEFIADYRQHEKNVREWMKLNKKSEGSIYNEIDNQSFYKGLFVENVQDDRTNYVVSSFLLGRFGD